MIAAQIKNAAAVGLHAYLPLFTATSIVLIALSGRAADPAARTADLVAVLQSEASLFDKARACQQLGEVGTPQAVPALAALLEDPKLSAYARSGLEGIPGSEAAAALRNAAQRIKGPRLAGVINSLGVIRDAQSTPLLEKLAAEERSGVVKEALLALGNIASPESIRFLERALTDAPEASRGEAAAALLLAADWVRKGGKLEQALPLYEAIRQAHVPLACRAGATRGAILARTRDRVPFVIEQLKSSEPAIRNAALATVPEVQDDALAVALNREIPSADPEKQAQLVYAAAACHNAASIPIVQALDSSPDLNIRRLALSVLGQFGPGAAPALIAALQKDRPADERALVVNGLKTLGGKTVDDQLVQALSSIDAPAVRIDLIRLLEDRGVSNASPELVRLANAPNPEVRVAALSALRALARPNDLPELVRLTRSSADEETREAAENAVAGVCLRSGRPASEAVLTELHQAKETPARQSWIRILARVGYAEALPAIKAAAQSADAAMAGTALAELGHWPNPAPMETLLAVGETGASPSLRQRALSSAIDLAAVAIDENQAPPSTIAGWLRRTNPAVRSDQDKLRIIGLLGRLPTEESLHLLTPLLDEPAVQTEAASAILQIAPNLSDSPVVNTLKTALTRIAASSSNAGLREKAQQAAKKLDDSQVQH